MKASAWVISDAGTGQVLAAKDPHGWYRPASTLKVLTAISLIPVLNPDATVVASKQAVSVSPNVVGLLPGHAYKISDLFTALLTISANDAAMALTQATGSLSQGMAVINAEARHLQADDTVAVTPNGLDAPGQHTLRLRPGADRPAGVADAGLPQVRPDDHARSSRITARRSRSACGTRTRCSPPTRARSAARSAGPARPAPPTWGWPDGTASR